MSIWNWIWDLDTDDAGRQRLWELRQQASRAFETAPEESIALYEQARQLAEQLGEKWWAMFCEHWKLQALLHKTFDYQSALDGAARAVIEVRKPIYADFPQRVCLHEDLISAYSGIDPAGYAPLIRDALNYMEREIRPDYECRACHAGLRAEFLRDIGDEGAVEGAWNYLRIADELDSDHDRAHATALLCQTLMICDVEEAQEHLFSLAQYGEEATHGPNLVDVGAELLMWQAVARRFDKEESESNRLQKRAIAQKSRTQSLTRPGFFQALVLWHEASGDLQAALGAIEAEIAEIAGKGQIWREAEARVKQCRLLAEMGRNWQEAETQTRAVAAKLKKPEFFGDQLDALRAQFSGE